jgi:hypothetical protein
MGRNGTEGWDGLTYLGRIASLAGLATLASILVVEVVVPSAIAGTPISGTLDRATISAYYDHAGLEVVLGLGLFAIALPAFVIFAVSVRELAADDRRARYWATLGSAFALCAVPVYVLKGAIAAALVGIVGAGLDPVALFRVYDLAYNGAIYPLEAAYVAGLGWTFVTLGVAPAWLRWLTIGAAAVQAMNGLVLFLGLPGPTTLPGNLAFALWLGAMSVTLWRMAPASEIRAVPATA